MHQSTKKRVSSYVRVLFILHKYISHTIFIWTHFSSCFYLLNVCWLHDVFSVMIYWCCPLYFICYSMYLNSYFLKVFILCHIVVFLSFFILHEQIRIPWIIYLLQHSIMHLITCMCGCVRACVCARAFTYNAFIHFMSDICIIYFSPLNTLLVFNCRVVGTIALKMPRHMVSETSWLSFLLKQREMACTTS